LAEPFEDLIYKKVKSTYLDHGDASPASGRMLVVARSFPVDGLCTPAANSRPVPAECRMVKSPVNQSPDAEEETAAVVLGEDLRLAARGRWVSWSRCLVLVHRVFGCIRGRGDHGAGGYQFCVGRPSPRGLDTGRELQTRDLRPVM
jgi:hypothetical protein